MVDEVGKSRLLKSLFKVIEDFEVDYQSKLIETEKTIQRLEQENTQLRDVVNRENSILDEVTDETLKKRLSPLISSPLDTIIREAGVVFEDRLRKIAGNNGKSQHGVNLVDTVLAPERGVLIFSSHVGEQQGVHMLYRGAMQFIRNPPMHNIIEYKASTAQLLIRLIDSLLNLLGEVKLETGENSDEKSSTFDEISVDALRHMLNRMPISDGQRNLYQALYKAGDKGLTNVQLTKNLNLTRYQLVGVLGALGRRINNTEGFENKGGIGLIFEISHKGNVFQYIMVPKFRRALELEKIV